MLIIKLSSRCLHWISYALSKAYSGESIRSPTKIAVVVAVLAVVVALVVVVTCVALAVAFPRSAAAFLRCLEAVACLAFNVVAEGALEAAEAAGARDAAVARRREVASVVDREAVDVVGLCKTEHIVSDVMKPWQLGKK